jgi:hypothetical protein
MDVLCGVGVTMRRYKQRVYDLAMQHKKQLDAIHEQGYAMPDSYDAPEKRSAR